MKFEALIPEHLKFLPMKQTILLPFCLLLFSASLIAQPVGHLTVFSDEGDKFFLILNGERQNKEAQTNIRIEDLSQPQYSAKIIFEDQSLGELSKNLYIADENMTLMDVTYKIKRDKAMKPKLGAMPFSAIPVRQGFVAPSNVYVVRYGAPVAAVAPVASGTTVTQTTTTTTGVPNTVGANVNINGMNMNMGISITDPTMMETTHTTTHTTTTSTGAPTRDIQPAGCANAYPMSAGDFSSALATVKNQGFDETRLKTAKQIASSNCLNTSQITQICNEFGFEESKLDFAKFAYEYCSEQKNYFKLNNIFGFSSSVDELTEYIQGRQ